MAGIYIHIPFCRKACIYCDFHFSTVLKSKNDLIKSILIEQELRKNYLEDEVIETIYFGGGTPSVLDKRDLELILNQIYTYNRVDVNVEISLECNPDDLDEKYLIDLKSLGINRLSIGLQSFNEEELQWMNRSHTAIQAERCVKLAQDIGFSNISVDLIYGSKFQTEELWLENLNKVFQLKVQHLSAYNLTVENKTVLGHNVKIGKELETDESLSVHHFNSLLIHAEKNGFIQYEISNFCVEGYYSRHNSNYWKGSKYLGLGPSAHSFNINSRQWNISNNNAYINQLKKGKQPFELENLSSEQCYNEYVMTSLRTIWGVSRVEIKRRFGDVFLTHFNSTISSYIQSEDVIVNNEVYVLSNKGKLLADRIASDVFI